MKTATIFIDGKTIRRSEGKDKKAVHAITAFASQKQFVVGQLATDEKSNEITAIPWLLDLFCVMRNIITMDTIGTQTDIASKIIEKEGDYELSVKGNQGNLHKNISLYMETEILTQAKTELIKKGCYSQTLEKGHGRVEKRECYLCPETDCLYEADRWKGLNGMGVILSRREEIGKESTICKITLYTA